MRASRKRPGRPADPKIRTRREEEILDAAAKLFAERGYSDTATQALADMLGVGKGTIYRYFPTKRDLFLAAADRVMRLMRARVDASIDGVVEPFERMSRAIDAYLGFFAEHPEYVELLIQERAHFKDRKKPTFSEHRDAHIGRWRDLYRKLIQEGRVRDIPPESITDVVGDLIYGTMFTNYFAGRDRSPKAQAREILDFALFGLLTDAARRQRAGDRRTAPAAHPSSRDPLRGACVLG